MTTTILTAVLVSLIGTVAQTEPSEPRPLYEEIKAMRPFTPAGAREVIARMHRGLVQPPGRVEGDARGVCARFLPKVVPFSLDDAETPCKVRLDGLEALAMCHYLSGSLKDARHAVTAGLVLERCDAPGPRGDGLARAVALADRWLWPDIVLPLVQSRLGKGKVRRGTDPQLKALALARRLKVGITRALGNRTVLTGAVVAAVESGSPGAGTGLQVGDVILTVASRPVSTTEELRAAVKGQRGNSSVVYLRAGQRKAGTFRGSAEGLQIRPIPERLVR